VLGAIGRVFIAIGLLLFGFAAYQVWGTGIQEARSQSALEKEFEALTKAAPSISPTTVATTQAPTTATAAPEASDPAETTVAPTTAAPTTTTTAPDLGLKSLLTAQDGDAVAIIEIPRLGLKKFVVSGVTIDDLRKGPGHYRNTALPGQKGNSAIAAHRTAYGSPFKEVDKMEAGDEIFITNALNERFTYRVRDIKVVEPTDFSVLEPSAEAILTLTSCTPLYTAKQRIIITSVLDEAATTAPIRAATPLTDKVEALPLDEVDPEVTAVPANESPTVGTDPTVATSTSIPSATKPGVTKKSAKNVSRDAFSKGWFSDKSAPPQVAVWGLVLSAIGLIAWQLSKKTRRNLIGGAVGILPFLLALYFFYENVNRLLPPSI
jgi:sortase A